MNNILKILFFLCIFSFYANDLFSQGIIHTISRIGAQEVFVNAKIEIYFSTLNNTQDISYFSNDMPEFCIIVSLNKGRGKIIAQPMLKDTGVYIITLEGNSNIGQTQQKFKLEVKNIPLISKEYYIDPVNGNDNNSGNAEFPFKTFEKVNSSSFNLAGGSVIYLRSGNYGNAVITKLNQDMVYVVAERGHSPGFESLNFTFSGNWYFSGMQISPRVGGKNNKTNYLNIGGGVNEIHINNCLIFGIEDINTWKTVQNWYDFAGNGIYSLGNFGSFKNNMILNTYFAVQFLGTNNEFNNNIIENFGGDAIRGIGSNCSFKYNQIKNAVVDDYATGNHDDAFQSWTFGNPVYNISLVGNQITDISYPELPLQTTIMQGIVDFDGFAENWIIENNLVVIHHSHGIALYGSTNSKIVNNTVIKNPFKKYFVNDVPWIRINKTKKGDISTGNLTRNNIMGSSVQDEVPGTFDNNIVSGFFDNLFNSYTNWDFSIKKNTIAYNAAINDECPYTDYMERLRDDSRPDIGCMELESSNYDFILPDTIEDFVVSELKSTSATLTWKKPNDNNNIINYIVEVNDEKYNVNTNRIELNGLYFDFNYNALIHALDIGNNKGETAVCKFKTPDLEENNCIISSKSSKYDFELNSVNKTLWRFEKNFRIDKSTNAILFFEVPPIPKNRKISEAIFSVTLLSKENAQSNIDLFALDFESDHEINENYFWNNSFDSQNAIGIPIQNDFILNSTNHGRKSTDFIGSKNIVEYIENQIKKGAHGGNYFIFRLNSDSGNTTGDKSIFKIASTDFPDSYVWPKLEIFLEDASSNNDETDNLMPEIYPNPSADLIFIDTKSINYSRIQIFNINISMIKELNQNEIENGIDISELDTGIYFLKLISNNLNFTIKVIKQ